MMSRCRSLWTSCVFMSFVSLNFLGFLPCALNEKYDDDGILDVEENYSTSAGFQQSLGQSYKITCPQNFIALEGPDLTCRIEVSQNFTNDLTTVLQLQMEFIFMEYDGSETILVQQGFNESKTSQMEVPCGYIVKGGLYRMQLVEELKLEFLMKKKIIVTSEDIWIQYPKIDFDVPSRLDAYSTAVIISFGFVSSLCKPLKPLPKTQMVLSIDNEIDTNDSTRRSLGSAKLHHPLAYNQTRRSNFSYPIRDFFLLYQDPLIRLHEEGRISFTVDCLFWGRNATFFISLREEFSQIEISRSLPIKVDWGNNFNLRVRKRSVFPCRGSIQIILEYPSCILRGRDRVRVYGYESLSVPSLLAPFHVNYLGEKFIRPDNRVISFKCSLFSQRFTKFCFQYVNEAVDESVEVVLETCVPATSLSITPDGGWGPWSKWSECSAECGSGTEFRFRFCDSPPPVSAHSFCKGKSIEERNCSRATNCSQNVTTFQTLNNTEGDPEIEVVATFDSSEALDEEIFFKSYTDTNFLQSQQCQCGCELNNMVIDSNYSLFVNLSSKHSSCLDSMKFLQLGQPNSQIRWVFNGGVEENVRVKIYLVALHSNCIVLTFRDGRNEDSNVLDIISTNIYDEDDLEESQVMIESSQRWLSIEASLHSTPSDENCTHKILYFYAVYSSFLEEIEGAILDERVMKWSDYEFWMFMCLKLSLISFLIFIGFSILGGCMTKAYEKNKKRESGSPLHSMDGDTETLLEANERKDIGEDSESKKTCVTIMSFDMAYWKHLRMLRLKRILLKPKKLDKSRYQTYSFPPTPQPTSRMSNWRIRRRGGSCSGNHKTMVNGDVGQQGGHMSRKSHSDDDFIHSRKLEERKERFIYRKMILNHSKSLKEHEKLGVEQLEDKHEGGQCEKESSMKKNGASLNEKPMSCNKLKDLKHDGKKNRSSNKKILKEKENIKRRASFGDKGKNQQVESLADPCLKRLNFKTFLTTSTDAKDKKGDPHKSDLSIYTNPSDRDSLKTMSRGELDDQELEMDYYDYDVENFGKIPGSYLGLEPAFVLWNSEMYANSEDESQSAQPSTSLPTTVDVAIKDRIEMKETHRSSGFNHSQQTSQGTMI